MSNQRKLAVAIVASIIIGVVGIVAWRIWYNSGLRITRATPAISGKISTATGTIRIDFNKKIINVSPINVSGQHSTLVNNVRVEDKSIFLDLGTLEEDERYSFSIGPVNAEGNKSIELIPVNVVAVYIPYDRLSNKQQDLEASQTDRDNQEDPLMQHLPYQGPDYYLSGEYSSDDEGMPVFIINADLFITREEVGANRYDVIEKYENQIRAFIGSKNLDASKYLIRSTVVEPPLSNR